MNNFFLVKANAAIRYLLVYRSSRRVPFYIITEYPRSGGTWVGMMLSEYLQVPFPRNRFPYFKESLIHGHYLYKKGISNTFCLFRDGRDVMVSSYFYSLFSNDLFNQRVVKTTKKHLGFQDVEQVRENLPAFIHYKFTGGKPPRFTWSEFIENWAGQKDVGFMYYEKLLEDPLTELSNAIKRVLKVDVDLDKLEEVVANCSFEKMAGREPGIENPNRFSRKGIAGDWKNYFSREAAEMFDHYAGKTLIEIGYEKNSDWVQEVAVD
ncbi:MAG: sulfotransferase domain-containing protein [bacterium]|nr:sulfotransferase domain-containing protein [bacterium]